MLQGGGDIARYIANDAGLPPDTPGLALNRQCATGMTAVDTAAANIRAGMDKVVIAGGAESMTQSPVTFRKPAHAFGVMQQWLSPSHPDSPEAPNMNMMITVGENTARKVGVTREEMDEWSYGSHMKAVAAIDEGRFADEIVPMEVRGWGGEIDDLRHRRAPAPQQHPREARLVARAVGRTQRHDHGRQLVAAERRVRGHGDRRR